MTATDSEAVRPPADRPSSTLRLLWPQWQGADAGIVRTLAPELPFGEARRGYVVGTTVLNSVLPAHSGPTVTVPVEMSDRGLEERDGLDAKDVLLSQLGSALDAIADVAPSRIFTIGGECSVSVAPFSWLADRYGDDLAVVWLDSHPDVGTPASEYRGYHAMAVATVTGHGDADIVGRLPAFVDSSRVALAGLHAWTEDDFPNAAAWGISTFGPDDLRTTSRPLLDWLAATGCSRVAIHLDVDVVDSNEVVLGLGIEPDGLSTAQVRRVIADVAGVADVVGFTVAEYIPRQVIRMKELVRDLPLT